MADLTVTELNTGDNDGTDMTASGTAAASGGDEFVNDGRTILRITSVASGTPTVTITAQKTSITLPGVGTFAPANKAVTLAAGNVTKQYHEIGPFPPAIFNDGDGRCQVTYSSETDLTVEPVRVKGE